MDAAEKADYTEVLAGVLASLTERFAAERAAGTLTALTDQQIAEWQVEALNLAGYGIVRIGAPQHYDGCGCPDCLGFCPRCDAGAPGALCTCPLPSPPTAGRSDR